VVAVLRRRAAACDELRTKLTYVRGFRIVDSGRNLRAGIVRDVAAGEVFINPRWTNDPWLLIGIAIRRSPWVFDPQFLRRPFYYRTASARMSSRLVLRHARMSLPFALFQVGHEVRAARYALFYRTLRALGRDAEATVREDGSYEFDQLLGWMGRRRQRQDGDRSGRPLWNDDEVVADLRSRWPPPAAVSSQEIATRYTYPLRYVEEVLAGKIAAAHPGLRIVSACGAQKLTADELAPVL
jgi:hypothetical protein